MAARGIARGLALLAGFAVGGAAAQNVPRSVEPGLIERQFERPTQPAAAEPLQVAPRPDTVAPEEDVRFVLGAVEFEGVTVYTPEQLAPLYRDLLAREIGLAEVRRIASAVGEKYRGDGYALSRAVVPEQDLSFGILRIRAIEGYVARVAFQGASFGADELPQRYAAKIAAERPLTLDTLERYLLLLADLPGLRASAGLNEIEGGNGAHELSVRAERDPAEFAARLDNRGTRPVGRYIAGLQSNFNALYSADDRTRADFFTVPGSPSELLFGEIAHERAIGAEGTRASLALSLSRIEAGGILEPSDVDSEERRAVLTLSHPLIRSRRQNLYASAKFDVRNGTQEIASAEAFDDRIRALRLGLQYSLQEAAGAVNNAAVEFSQGLDLFGASERGSGNLSRADGDPAYSKVGLTVSRLQPLWAGLALNLAAAAQKSADPLLSAEEFTVGGPAFGRAYDPAELGGDDGIGGQAELRYDLGALGAYVPALQLFAFYDFGRVWDRGGDATSLASAGLGARAQLLGAVTGSIELDKPLTRVVAAEGDRDPRLFFTLGVLF